MGGVGGTSLLTAGEDILLVGRSNKPGSSDVVLISGITGPAVGYRLMQPNVGNVDWSKLYSGMRGTQGARLAGAEAQNRAVSLLLEVVGEDQDDLQSRLSRLWALDDEWRRFGGTLTWRPQGGSFKVYFDVLDSSVRIGDYDRKFHLDNRLTVELAPVCAPLLRGDPMDILDRFDTDTAGDYTKDTDGALFTVKGGKLVPGQTGTSRWRHTGRGYEYGDQEATLKVTTGSTVASISIDLFICGDTAGAETFFSAQLQGGNLNVAKWVAGVNTWPATTAFALSTNKTYWLRVRREGRRVTASAYTSEPTPLATPAATVSYTLSLVENWLFALGHAGFRTVVVSTGERYADFRVEPFTYANNLVAPDERALRPEIPGDAPALADISVTQSGGSAIPIWGLLGWWERPSVWNYVWNGDFEDDVDGWSVAAVAGVTGAATSIARSTTAALNKYGGANAQIVTPATANTGATFKINRRFYQGRDYILLIWASSAAQTTAARARLGVSGDIASTLAGSIALSPTPTLHRVLWTPSADRDGAYVCFEVTAATLTTMNIDAVMVVESRGASLTNNIDATQTTAVVDRIPDDWPTAPFQAVLAGAAAEIVYVSDINYATRTLTIVRGQEGTTAGATASTNLVIPLPTIRSHYEGKGAQPPVGVIEAESDDRGNLFTWTEQANGATRLGNFLYKTGIGAAGSAAADWLVDPHLLIPDEFTQGELAIEAWGRITLHNAMTGCNALLSAAPESATVTTGVMTSTFGATRYTEEYGTVGKIMTMPASAEAGRFVKLGTIRFPVDMANPGRWRMQLRMTWGGGTASTIGLDYLVLVPAGQRALSPSGKANDTNFPKFIASLAETVKTIRSDLSGLVAEPPFAANPDHGLGGSLLELPPGNVDLVLKTSNSVPDDPTSDNSGDVYQSPAGVVHLSVVPRFTLGRDE